VQQSFKKWRSESCRDLDALVNGGTGKRFGTSRKDDSTEKTVRKPSGDGPAAATAEWAGVTTES